MGRCVLLVLLLTSTALAGLADVPPPGTYSLGKDPRERHWHVDGKELPSCGEEAKKLVESFKGLSIYFRQKVWVAGHEWSDDGVSGDKRYGYVHWIHQPDSSKDVRIMFGFFARQAWRGGLVAVLASGCERRSELSRWRGISRYVRAVTTPPRVNALRYAGTVTCPFCDPAQDRIAVANSATIVLHDLYPVTPGHLLVVPRRHVARWSDATSDERTALLAEVEHAREYALSRDATIEGFNIGWNDGPAAGQTVMHLHVHVIPRRTGDVADPRGGIRWIVPERARYWSA